MSKVILFYQFMEYFKVIIKGQVQLNFEKLDKVYHDERTLKLHLLRYGKIISLSKDERINLYFERIAKELYMDFERANKINIDPKDRDLILIVKADEKKEKLTFNDIRVIEIELEQYY